jgi:nitrate/TMAO reductase-like tetraheme cytochrome c subunit
MKKFIMFSIIAFVVFVSIPLYLYSAEKTPLDETINQRLRSQFFCGYCHVLTYPKVMKKAYESWKIDKHNNVRCVECHYPPERLGIKIPEHERIPRDEGAALMRTDWEYMNTELAILSRLTTILNMEEPVVRTKPRIDDSSCTTSKCHPTTGKGKEGEYWTKKITFTEYERGDKTKAVIPFIHKTHFEKEKLVEGQEMHCATCHQRETEQKHFEVSREKCYLCHFKNLALNEKRSTCSLCHEIPTKPLQKKEPEPGAKLITHQTIEKDKVPCISCHVDMVKGKGVISTEKCLNCHDNEKPIIKETTNIKLMHEKHVAEQNASCFSCHEPIQHKKADFLEVARESCAVCHPEHHISQKVLLAGPERKGVPETPSLMYDVRTGCQGCHMEERVVKGEKVLHGDSKACAKCHVEKTAQMVKEWKDSVAKALNEAKELEKEAKDAIARAKDKVPKEKLEEVIAIFKEGQENMQLVEAGGGVHNQKYSIQLLDTAMGNFEEAIDLVKE